MVRTTPKKSGTLMPIKAEIGIRGNIVKDNTNVNNKYRVDKKKRNVINKVVFNKSATLRAGKVTIR